MEKLNQKSFLLELAEANKDIIYNGHQALAKLSFLKNWELNPKFSESSDIKKLEEKIEKVGLFKPIVITLEKNYGEVLGGNQRLIALKNLREKYLNKKSDKYEYVWVSIVNTETLAEKKVIAFLDNEEIGKYDIDKLKELIDKDLMQMDLFNNIQFKIDVAQTSKEILDRIALSREEYEFKDVKKTLKRMGINEETIKALETMTTFSKIKEGLEDVDLKGCTTGQKFPLLFWIDDEISFEEYKKIYGTKYKDKYDTDKLKYITEKILEVHIPTVPEELEKLNKNLEELNSQLKEHLELQGNPKTIEKIKVELNNVKSRIEELNNSPFPENEIKNAVVG
jgi:hypothetical protein